NTACVINAANEVAVAAFLHGYISFPEIYGMIEHALSAVDYIGAPNYEDYVATNAKARAIADEAVEKKKRIGSLS
ncbi:MAG: 1-deoxy-D-xylulose-5-phosphate reductoisomerase, partial [Muribaculaceae bacterium]|nr:1-deoxy-D-xylulose-5-phosphate reductoisomerase [Muribaculaceae bacterium]